MYLLITTCLILVHINILSYSKTKILKMSLLYSPGLCVTPKYGNRKLEHIFMELYIADY
jgi:hypothetical protein